MAHIPTGPSSPLGRILVERSFAICGSKAGYYTEQAVYQYAAMQLKRAIEGRPLATKPTPMQIQRGVTPAMEGALIEMIGEALAEYTDQVVREALVGARSLCLDDRVSSAIRTALDGD